ncbi:MAG: hypothetical protein ACRCXZ_01540 [Patescibacteria group bacterium]
MLNIILLQKPNQINQKNLETLNKENQELKRKNSSMLSDIELAQKTVKQLATVNEELQKQLENDSKNSSSVDPSDQEDLRSEEEKKSLNTTTKSTNKKIDVTEKTQLKLVGNGCVFKYEGTPESLKDKQCDLIEESGGVVIKRLVDCAKGIYLIYPEGSDDVCIQGSDLRLGKRDSQQIYINNFATTEGTGQNLQVLSMQYTSKELEFMDTLYAAPRIAGVDSDPNVLDLGGKFVIGYKKYVADTVPDTLYNSLFLDKR